MTPTIGTHPAATPMPGVAHTHGRLLRWALALTIALGTLAGVVVTSVLAILLAAPQLITSGLEPRPEGPALGWLVSPEVAGPSTRALLWLLAIATVVLAGLVAAGARWRWLWRAYAAWAVAGGLLTTYALVANWALARDAGFLALVVGALWSALVALGLARLHHWTRAHEERRP